MHCPSKPPTLEPSPAWLIPNAVRKHDGLHVIFGPGGRDFAGRLRAIFERARLPAAVIDPSASAPFHYTRHVDCARAYANIYPVLLIICEPASAYHVKAAETWADVSIYSHHEGLVGFVTKCVGGPAGSSIALSPAPSPAPIKRPLKPPSIPRDA